MILSRIRLLPQQRYDLEDFISQQSGVLTDSKFYTKQFLSNLNYILKGFSVTGIGLTSATVNTTDATLIHGANTFDFSWYTSESGSPNITVPAAALTDGTKNYLELKLGYETNTSAVKAFWDPSANGGLGLEFNQEIDTQTDLMVTVEVLTGGFSGNPDRIPLAIVDVDNLGNIIGILDKRELFFKLGTIANPYNSFSWASQEEPEITLTLSGVVGTFTTGEEVTFSGGATATVSQGGTTTIKVRLPDSDSYTGSNTVTGTDSGAIGTLSSYIEDFTGADKDISNFKKLHDAILTEIKFLKGTDFWFQQGVGSLNGVYSQLNSILVQASLAGNARFSWTGSSLLITDNSVTPATADVIAVLNIFGIGFNYELTRQDGTGGSSVINIADGEMLFIKIPKDSNRVFSGTGVGATNYQIIASTDFERIDENYWLAYRRGSKLYLRGLGELDAGESKQVSDETPDALKTFLGFDPETATTIPFTALPNIGLPGQFTVNDTLVEAISANTQNINLIDDILNTNTYEEVIEVVAAFPSGNQLLGPVLAGTPIILPLDSRDSNNNEFYVVGAGVLEVYLNGRYLRSGIDYNEIGAINNPSNEIQMIYDLEVDDELTFRQDATGGILSTSSGLDTLQDVYNNGRIINVASAQPVVINGPVSEKLLVINGDIEVTGVIDPKGITFTREATNPLIALGQDGLWVDSTGNLNTYKHGVGSVDITSIVSGGGAATIVKDSFVNGTLSTLSKGALVSIDSDGELELIDVSDEQSVDSFVGIVYEDIDSLASGDVVVSGRLENITTSIAVGQAVYISKTGTLTTDKPNIGVNDFEAGDFVVKVGLIVKNKDNPLQKDLLVRVSTPKQL
ncbi:MAG: hypothetical protein MOGMAGMI_00391 [Candidatus Omnitrophica bacterium]|nr:hypothetical protein [Candidatus Omnitrophota bacterium]